MDSDFLFDLDASRDSNPDLASSGDLRSLQDPASYIQLFRICSQGVHLSSRKHPRRGGSRHSDHSARVSTLPVSADAFGKTSDGLMVCLLPRSITSSMLNVPHWLPRVAFPFSMVSPGYPGNADLVDWSWSWIPTMRDSLGLVGRRVQDCIYSFPGKLKSLVVALQERLWAAAHTLRIRKLRRSARRKVESR